MKAIVYTRYGPPDVLRVVEHPMPVPRAGEVLLRVRAVEATKSDCEMRSLRFQVSWLDLPMRVALGWFRPRRRVLGGYFSGVVAGLGEEVDGFAVGAEVFGSTRLRLGAYGEYVCLPADYTIVRKPSNIGFHEAATVPLGGLNALHFLRLADVGKGEEVLINGAGGSIGIYGVQIAKAMGARVTAVDHPRKRGLLLDVGADMFLDYTRESFSRKGPVYDVIFSMVARTGFRECMSALKPGGRYILANPKLSDMARGLLAGWRGDKVVRFAFAGEKKEELQTLADMIETGRLRPVVDRVYTMEQAAEAHRRVEAEERLGPTVISL